jgi:hypothetical protein
MYQSADTGMGGPGYLHFEDFSINGDFDYTHKPDIKLSINFYGEDNKKFPAITHFTTHLLSTKKGFAYKEIAVRGYTSLNRDSIYLNDSMLKRTVFIDPSVGYELDYHYKVSGKGRLPAKLSVAADFDYINHDSLCHYSGIMAFRKVLQGTSN